MMLLFYSSHTVGGSKQKRLLGLEKRSFLSAKNTFHVLSDDGSDDDGGKAAMEDATQTTRSNVGVQS